MLKYFLIMNTSIIIGKVYIECIKIRKNEGHQSMGEFPMNQHILYTNDTLFIPYFTTQRKPLWLLSKLNSGIYVGSPSFSAFHKFRGLWRFNERAFLMHKNAKWLHLWFDVEQPTKFESLYNVHNSDLFSGQTYRCLILYWNPLIIWTKIRFFLKDFEKKMQCYLWKTLIETKVQISQKCRLGFDFDLWAKANSLRGGSEG